MVAPTTPFTHARTLKILKGIRRLIARITYLSSDQSRAITLWVLHTYVYQSFEYSPILLVTAPSMGCGKSRAIQAVGLVAKDAVNASGASTSSLIRTAAASGRTVLLDEGETFLGDLKLQGFLNGGFNRDSAHYRMNTKVNGNWTPTDFDTYVPNALSMNGLPHSTTIDRSVTIWMSRKPPHVPLERVNAALRKQAESLRAELGEWADAARAELELAQPERPDGLTDRAWDIWSPLLAIAESVDADVAEQARETAQRMAEQHRDNEEGPGVQVLRMLCNELKMRPATMLRTREIVAMVNDSGELPCGRLAGRPPLTSQGLASLMRTFGIRLSPNTEMRPLKNT